MENKMKEKEKRKQRQNCRLSLYCRSEGDVSSIQNEADICSESRENTKETKIGSYYKG